MQRFYKQNKKEIYRYNFPLSSCFLIIYIVIIIIIIIIIIMIIIIIIIIIITKQYDDFINEYKEWLVPDKILKAITCITGLKIYK